jgi:hypothetical protein
VLSISKARRRAAAVIDMERCASRRWNPGPHSFSAYIERLTLDRVGILLTRPMFGHGQLYVAFSRVRSLKCVKVSIVHAADGEPLVTNNVVWKEVLQQ